MQRKRPNALTVSVNSASQNILDYRNKKWERTASTVFEANNSKKKILL